MIGGCLDDISVHVPNLFQATEFIIVIVSDNPVIRGRGEEDSVAVIDISGCLYVRKGENAMIIIVGQDFEGRIYGIGACNWSIIAFLILGAI